MAEKEERERRDYEKQKKKSHETAKHPSELTGHSQLLFSASSSSSSVSPFHLKDREIEDRGYPSAEKVEDITYPLDAFNENRLREKDAIQRKIEDDKKLLPCPLPLGWVCMFSEKEKRKVYINAKERFVTFQNPTIEEDSSMK
ncbi:hypothetical protein ADUPG1_008897 [Aduncisulcus paluster]|uniref:WW domain-containing protein n=1 Tax=Aduncisulcus paluster TaxID=2918883 RepID=A0ABQ5KVW5_9EUKA|nr:hypothetical protein ADUPG1_008897 [Aduncisulcus paluster]